MTAEPSSTLHAVALLAFSTAITPGPNNLMLLASGARFGLVRTLPHLAGVVSGTTAMVALNVVGVGALMLAWPAAVPALKLAGAGYLVYLAWRLTRGGALGAHAGAAAAQPLNLLQAASFQLVNPKVWMMGLATATTIDGGDAAVAAAGVLVFTLVALPCILLWAAFGVVMLRVLRTPRARTAFNLTIGVGLIATAAMMLQ